jgi:hypothetical protein
MPPNHDDKKGSNKNGWEENSRLVLAELQRLNKNYEELNTSVLGLTDEVTKVKAVWHVVDELKEWKTNMSEVASATQLKDALDKVAKLETFKTVSTTVWAVIQTIVIAYLTYKGVF